MKEETKKIIRLAASGVLFALGLILDKTVGLGYYSLLFYIPAYLIAGYDVLWRAVKNLVRGSNLKFSFKKEPDFKMISQVPRNIFLEI